MRNFIHELTESIHEKRQREKEMFEKTEKAFLDSLRESYRRTDENGEFRATRLVADIVDAFEKNGYSVTKVGIGKPTSENNVPLFLINNGR